LDELGQAVEAASISILGESGGTISGKDGEYSISIPANKNVTLVVTHISYQRQQKRLLLTPNEVRRLVFSLKSSSIDINEVEVEEEQNRDRPMETIDRKNIKYIPSPSGSFEAVVKTLPGVSSNNELTSQYNVRGGNFDENLVYVNDIQVYRPFLIRSG